MSDAWRNAEGVFISKKPGVGDFRTISMLNVESKLFFAPRADRLAAYAVADGYINTKIQMGGVPGILGCLEHRCDNTVDE